MRYNFSFHFLITYFLNKNQRISIYPKNNSQAKLQSYFQGILAPLISIFQGIGVDAILAIINRSLFLMVIIW